MARRLLSIPFHAIILELFVSVDVELICGGYRWWRNDDKMMKVIQIRIIMVILKSINSDSCMPSSLTPFCQEFRSAAFSLFSLDSLSPLLTISLRLKRW